MSTTQPQQQPPNNYPPFSRLGDLMVMDRSAKLPEICLKSAQPTDKMPLVTLDWIPNWTLIVGALLALLFQTKAQLRLPFTDELLRWQKQRVRLAWRIGMAGGGLLFISFIIAAGSPVTVPLLLQIIILAGVWGGLIAIVGSVIFAMFFCNLVSAAYINETHVWIKGVHPDILARLPEWKGESPPADISLKSVAAFYVILIVIFWGVIIFLSYSVAK